MQLVAKKEGELVRNEPGPTTVEDLPVVDSGDPSRLQERLEEVEALLAAERQEVSVLRARLAELEVQRAATSFLANAIGFSEKAWANLITQSGLFDSKWYLARYPDVREAGVDPAVHYLRHGAAEGRQPSPHFGTEPASQSEPCAGSKLTQTEKAPAAFANLFEPPAIGLRNSVIPGNSPRVAFGTQDEIGDHLNMVRQELVGRTELEFVHCAVIVLLRRGISPRASWQRFNELWGSEGEFLLGALNARWLVSACDTIIDYSPDLTERALALAGSLFVNTIRLYETELWMKSVNERPYVKQPQPGQRLFQGLTPFMAGSGDMVRNLKLRLGATCAEGGLPGAILRELFRRMVAEDTVYRRFLGVHAVESTRWD
jgi:hypothetical protein